MSKLTEPLQRGWLNEVFKDVEAELDLRLSPELSKEIRTFLWTGHGHRGMYGDDGEMQCGECARYGCVDYKRAPMADVVCAAKSARYDVNLMALSK